MSEVHKIMSVFDKVLSRIPGLPKPRSGRLETTRFTPEESQTPIKDAVQFTNTIKEGGEIVEQRKSARVNLKNGNSLLSNGERVEVWDPENTPLESFPGSLTVNEGFVSVEDRQGERVQSWTKNGGVGLTDKGLLVHMNSDGTASGMKFVNNNPVSTGTSKEKDGLIRFETGETAAPIFRQEWLIASPQA